MRRNHRKFTIGGATVLLCAFAVSGSVEFTVNPERTRTALNQPLRVTATVVSTQDLGQVQAPVVRASDAFKVVHIDHNQSSSSTTSIMNGRVESKVEISYTFTYTIAPTKLGAFSFPELTLTVGAAAYSTQPFIVEVVNEVPQSMNVIARVSCSKRSLYVGEQAVLTVKIGQKTGAPVQLTTEGFRGFLESVSGALGSAFALVDLTRGKIGGAEEIIDGERYVAYTVRYALFPLTAGSHAVPAEPMQYNVLRQASRRSMDPFGDFFGGGVQAEPATVTSNSLRLDVTPLPPTPANFSGIVGTASLSADANPKSVAAGDGVTLKITIQGSTRPGSLAEIALPAVAGLEVYTPEKHTDADTSAAGINTRRSYKYLVIPRSEGTVTIPPIEISYFDPARGTYQTLSTGAFALTVSKGQSGGETQRRYMSQSEIREVGQDIRYIKVPDRIRGEVTQPQRSPVWLAANAIPFCVLLFSILYRFQAIQRVKDPTVIRRRRAHRRARRALDDLVRKPGTDEKSFAGGLNAAIDDYVSDRFGFASTGMVTADLVAALGERGAPEDARIQLVDLLAKVDMYRFAGGAFGAGSRPEMVRTAHDIVDQLDRSAQRSRR